jgi:hypothetical protein
MMFPIGTSCHFSERAIKINRKKDKTNLTLNGEEILRVAGTESFLYQVLIKAFVLTHKKSLCHTAVTFVLIQLLLTGWTLHVGTRINTRREVGLEIT